MDKTQQTRGDANATDGTMYGATKRYGVHMYTYSVLSLCIRSDLPLVTSFYAFTYALTPLPYCNYVLCTMWFCLHVLHLLYVVPLVSGKDHVPLGYI